MKGKKVLIVEDDPDQAEALAAVLKLRGVASETAGTLALALVRLGSHDSVGCVVLDPTLPDATGTVGVAALQTAHPLIPIVVLTGCLDTAPEEFIRAGAQEVIYKPGDHEQLVRAIRTAVARHKVRSEYRPYTEALQSAQETVAALVEVVKGPPPKE